MPKRLPLLIIVVAAGAFFLGSAFQLDLSVTRRPFLTRLLSSVNPGPTPVPTPDDSVLQTAVLPANGIIIPVKWGDLGSQLIRLGVIDQEKFENVYANAGGLGDSARLLENDDRLNLVITPQNSHIILNLLWALGLGNQNPILDSGPMVNKEYGGAGNFASTGGWSLSQGSAMQHYSKHQFIKLTTDQQILVEEVSKNIFRPCCNNSTYFPDCNHGMAMLALLQLMAAQNVNEEDMYRYALAVNSYWFPDTYLNIAKLKASQGVSWEAVSPKEVLGEAYSSATGYQQVLSQVDPVRYSGGGSCGV